MVQTGDGQLQLTKAAEGLYRELGVAGDAASAVSEQRPTMRLTRWARWPVMSSSSSCLALLAVMFFFVVLLIGFAYEWKTVRWIGSRALAARITALAKPIFRLPSQRNAKLSFPLSFPSGLNE